MFTRMRARGRALGLALAALGALVGVGLLPGARSVGAAPPAQEKTERVGIIHVMTLDNAGGGYAWANAGGPNGGRALHLGGSRLAAPLPAAAAATPEPGSFLLRITPGHWFVLADSLTAPTLLVPGLDVWRMVVSADGQEGWAAGQVVQAGAAATPVLLRLHQGTWGSAAAVLAPDYIPIDLTFSADGQAGWLTARNAAGVYKLWRWDGAQWIDTTEPAGAPLTLVAISPDGRQGWAVSAGAGLLGLNGGIWSGRPIAGPPPALTPTRVTADDAGNGWLLADAAPAGATAPSVLLRLTPANAPQEAALASTGAGASAHLGSLATDASGQGWSVGGGSGQPVFVRLSPESARVLPAAEVSLPADFVQPATVVTVSADGRHTWVGNAAGQMAPLSEAAPPGMPSTGTAVTGAAWILLVSSLLLLSGLSLLALRRHRLRGRSW
ncbi:MAG TPA: hypothetical protein VKY74_01060 [Chloroflexia bacterium]|nr:hypothetical protein [Chloroflexia bacterium]